MSRVICRLKRWWPPDEPRENQVDLYEEIKAGRKTSEFREVTNYWTFRLFKIPETGFGYAPKVDRIWFIVGFPKGNVPRLEADVTRIVVHCDDDGWSEQYEIKFENVVEVFERTVVSVAYGLVAVLRLALLGHISSIGMVSSLELWIYPRMSRNYYRRSSSRALTFQGGM